MADLKQYTDQALLFINWVKLINDENDRQLHKWGVQTRSGFEWLTYAAEEAGELAEAISEHEYRGGSREKVIKEAIQLATLAIKIAEIYAAWRDDEHSTG